MVPTFCTSVLAAAEVALGYRVLDFSTGTGEAALMTLPIVGTSGLVIGADISPAMVEAARDRLNESSFWPVAADGQALPFRDGSFDAVTCQLGLQFFADPALGLKEFRRVLCPGGCAAACVTSTPDRAPMAGIFADAISRFLPEQPECPLSLVRASRPEATGTITGQRRVPGHPCRARDTRIYHPEF